MNFPEPMTNGFTVYSKSGCHNCLKIKNILKENNILFIEINCDEYLIEDRTLFLSFIEKKIGKYYNTFPITFFNGKFIGDYIEVVKFIDESILSFECTF